MDMRTGIMGIIGVVVVLVMFGALMPMVTDTIALTEATGTIGTLLNNLPLFLGIVLSVIGYSLVYLRRRD